MLPFMLLMTHPREVLCVQEGKVEIAYMGHISQFSCDLYMDLMRRGILENGNPYHQLESSVVVHMTLGTGLGIWMMCGQVLVIEWLSSLSHSRPHRALMMG
ncbi:uncharacterized protein LOC129320297 [Prosopis cineraria]|uniref:uncharacterized protein LOC129320297 n=1 Tax=Prosopis cineraria TaxID=364024 RepID=UPI0024106892|nr:uncharacterized protein LOC129320297 [Prosopis cineraria]